MNLVNQQSVLEPRIDFQMVSVREFLVISGGYDNVNYTEYNDLLTYNTISGVVKRYQRPIELKDLCRFHLICVNGNKVYICLIKYIDEQYQHIHSLVSFDVSNSTWETIYSHTEDHDYDDPIPMDLIFFFCHNGYLYVIGRRIEEHEDVHMYKFCMKSSTWTLAKQIGSISLVDGDIYGTVFKNQLLIFENGLDESIKFKEVKIFDLSSNTWTTRAAYSKNILYPDYRENELYAFSSSCAYMSGGFERDSNLCNSDIWRLDFETMEWLQLEYTFKKGIFRYIMSVVDDTYLYCAGRLHGDSYFLNTLERFIIRPPSLYRLCHESLCRSPNMGVYTKLLPASIVDELNLNYNESSVDD